MIGDGSYGDQYDAIPASESHGGSAGRKRRPKYDEIEQLIFAMRLQGMSDNEIHKELNRRIPWRTLDNVFARIKRFDRQAVWRAFRRQHLASASFEGEDPVREEFEDLLEQMSIGPHSKYAEIAGAMLVMLREEEPRATPGEIMNALKARGISDDRAVSVWSRVRTASGRRHLLRSVTVAETLVRRLQLWCLESTPTRQDVASELALAYDIDEQEAEEALDLLEDEGIIESAPVLRPDEGYIVPECRLADGPNGGWQEEEYAGYYPVVGGGFISSHDS